MLNTAVKTIALLTLSGLMLSAKEPQNKRTYEIGTAHVDAFYGPRETTMFVANSNCAVKRMVVTLRYAAVAPNPFAPALPETESKALDLTCDTASRVTFDTSREIVHIEMSELETNVGIGLNP